jgi:hypothetical protein
LKLEDRIQQYVLKRFIEPARARGEVELEIRVAEVQRAMRLSSLQPEIARVLSHPDFAAYAGVRLLRRRGPHMGGGLVFTFEIAPEQGP